MAIWIDPPRWPAHGRLWSHLISDTSYEELHEFAAAAGVPRRGFEGDHYDVPEERYAALVAAGAQPVDGHELVRRLRASGLRFAKRKGERPLATYRNVLRPETLPHTLHVVASRLETPALETSAAAVFVRDREGSILLVHSVVRDLWGAPAGGREPGETVRECAVREVWEESGLLLSERTLRPCGYERVVFDRRADAAYGRWGRQRSYVAVFATGLPSVRPPVAPGLADVDAAEWVTPDEAERRCRGVFWWPLLAQSDPWG
ncbi:MAG TPA: DUF4031 domain-containing protein [Dermatophilaceae bacterium]|nr:DUF4031 domain-containing protein [Dermatophilaceae bacterium]